MGDARAYAVRAGTGFTDLELERLAGVLKPLQTRQMPLAHWRTLSWKTYYYIALYACKQDRATTTDEGRYQRNP